MKKIIIALAAAVAVLVLAVGCGQAPASRAADSAGSGSYRQVSPEDALALMQSEDDYVILDVRTAQEFAQGHIPDAVNVPVETIGAEPPASLPDLNQLIMVYCRSGNRSKQAAEKLVALGYENIVEFGGINDWPGEVVRD